MGKIRLWERGDLGEINDEIRNIPILFVICIFSILFLVLQYTSVIINIIMISYAGNITHVLVLYGESLKLIIKSVSDGAPLLTVSFFSILF